MYGKALAVCSVQKCSAACSFMRLQCAEVKLKPCCEALNPVPSRLSDWYEASSSCATDRPRCFQSELIRSSLHESLVACQSERAMSARSRARSQDLTNAREQASGGRELLLSLVLLCSPRSPLANVAPHQVYACLDRHQSTCYNPGTNPSAYNCDPMLAEAAGAFLLS